MPEIGQAATAGSSGSRSTRQGAPWSLAAGLFCFVVLLATSEILPMAWDEGNAIDRANGILHWFGRFSGSNPGPSPFSAAAIHDDWQYVDQIEGHPAFYGAVIAAGHALSAGSVAPLTSYRLGPMALFALAVGAMHYRLRTEFGGVAAWSAVGALLTAPRLFAHAHFASFDGPLTSCWLLAWATFPPAIEGGWRRAAVWGACLGLTMSCKFTGWLAIGVFLSWCVAFRRRVRWRNVLAGIAVAAATFVAVNPPLWHGGFTALHAFFDANLNRAAHGINVPTTFFGETHDIARPLPWYNSLFWTAATVPAGTLALAIIGAICAALGRGGAPGMKLLVLAQWAVLPSVKAMPFAPPHDAERLILPSFAFLAALAGIGAAAAWTWGAARLKRAGRRWLATGLALLLLGSASSLVWYSPQWLSYYSLFVGGLRGATALGLEPTYYWDSLDSETLDWLHSHTAANEFFAIGAPSPQNLQLQRDWGVLQRDWTTTNVLLARWYVVQMRPSFHRPIDRLLLETERPVFQKTVRPPDWGWGPWRLDTPILCVFSRQQMLRASRDLSP